MRTNIQSSEGFKINLNYQRIYTPSGKKGDWRQHSLGCGQIILIGLIGDALCEQDLPMSRRFPSPEIIYNQFLIYCPWAPAEYAGENPLSAKIVWNRFHKMYYRNKAKTRQGRGMQSDEHYMNDMKLRPWVPQVEVLYRRGKVITREELLDAMKGWKR